MWKGSKDKREKLEDEMDWNKLARFCVFSILASKLSSHLALTSFLLFYKNHPILLFFQAADAILGHHEGTMGPVGNHFEFK